MIISSPESVESSDTTVDEISVVPKENNHFLKREPSNPLEQEIVRLRTIERLSYAQIFNALQDNASLESQIGALVSPRSIKTICEHILTTETRREIAEYFSNATKDGTGLVHDGHRKWMEAQNQFVWSEEHLQYFLQLIRSGEFVRPPSLKTQKKLKADPNSRERRPHFNHETIAEAMNLRFGTTAYTKEKCMRKLDRLRKLERDNNVKIVELEENHPNNVKLEDGKLFPFPEEFSFGNYIKWLYLNASNDRVGLNIHEFRRAMLFIAPHIHSAEWEDLAEQIEEAIPTFVSSVRQLLHDVLAECHLQVGDTWSAAKVLEAGIRLNGVLADRLNNRLQEIAATEVAVGRVARHRLPTL